MFQIKVDVSSSNALKERAKKIRLSKSLLDAIGSQFVILVQRQFDRGLDPYNRPWQPLAPSTVRKKGNTRILVATGELKNSISYKLGGKNQVTLDINRRYPSGYNASIHQLGLGRLPKRIILPTENLPPVWKSAVTRLINQYFK